MRDNRTTMNRDILQLTPPTADYRVPYGSEPAQFGDLWLPAGDGPHPVVVLLHGGYWRARYGLEYFGHAAEALRAAGLAVWNVEYRRLGDPGGGWPGTFQDVGRAVDAVRDLPERFPLDVTKVVTLGHSAGGQLALWAAARHRLSGNSPLASPTPLPLAGAIALAGVNDLRRAWELRLSDAVVNQLLGASPAAVGERYSSASPFDLLPLGVPQVLIHGTDDVHVPPELSERHHQAALAAGDRCELTLLAGTDHFEVVDPRSEAWQHVLSAVRTLR
jgi:acetyl esterase/lipase